MHPSRYRPDVFLQLKQSALNLARKTAPYAAPPPAQLPSIPKSDGPFLPLPGPLVPRLISLGVDEASAYRISSSLTRAALRLKEVCEKEFQRRLKTSPPCFDDPQSVSRIPFTITAIYTRAIREWSSYLLDNVAPRVLHLQSQRRTAQSLSGQGFKVPFNHDATPALELFFEDNAFPSRLEKHELAAKWGMRYRQIDVWFQNRRRRFKNQGKELKQRPDSNTLLRDLEQTVVDSMLPLLSEDEELEPREWDDEADVPTFNLKPPVHAFPGPWPPLCPYDPFPITPGQRVFDTPWPRSPSTTTPTPQPTDLVLEELVYMFGKLTFSDSSTGEIHASPPRGCGAQPCPSLSYIGFSTHCLRAPLPALLSMPRRASRPRRNTGCSSVTPAHVLADNGEHKKMRGSESHHSWNGSLQGSALSSTPESRPPRMPTIIAPSCRTKRCLPKRYPKNPPRRRASGDANSTTRSVTVLSASTSSTGSLSSQTSSPSSDTDSPLSTPQLLSMSLPDPIVFDASQSWITYLHAQSPVDILDSGLSFSQTCAPILADLSKIPDDPSPISLYIPPSIPQP